MQSPKKPEVSILIANYNKSRFLTATLLSIQNQKFKNWECIIVDDHSTDNSMDILLQFEEKDSRFKVFTRPVDLPKGANPCRNFAYSKSIGDLIQWFDSDDIMLPQFLQSKFEFLKNQSSYKFVVSKGEIDFEKDYHGHKKVAQSFYSKNVIEDYLRFKLIFFTPGPMFRREVFEKVGLFNPNLPRHQEWELFFRVILNFPKWGVIEASSFIYKLNNNSITNLHREKKLVAKTELLAFKEVFSLESNPFRAKIPKKIRRSFSFKYLQVALYYMELRLFVWFLGFFLNESVSKKT